MRRFHTPIFNEDGEGTQHTETRKSRPQAGSILSTCLEDGQTNHSLSIVRLFMAERVGFEMAAPQTIDSLGHTKLMSTRYYT